jgi:RNA polymerase II subunit A small phosphatase-like protein
VSIFFRENMARRVSFGEPAPEQQRPKAQRYRGVSFKKEYEPQNTFQKLKKAVAPKGGRKRAPSMIHEPTKHMIPPKRRDDKTRYTIVLDLDETLIYAREGPLYARPHLDELLAFLGEHCETVVWTAGVRAYAQAVIRNIDPNGVIDHCIYRHEKWFTGQAGYAKDLALVGRDLSQVLIVENTPDCVRGHEENGILVSDYEGGEATDNTLPAITKLIDDLVHSGLTVPEYLKRSPMLSRQAVPTDLGDKLSVYCLDPAKANEARVNRDLANISKR